MKHSVYQKTEVYNTAIYLIEQYSQVHLENNTARYLKQTNGIVLDTCFIWLYIMFQYFCKLKVLVPLFQEEANLLRQ